MLFILSLQELRRHRAWVVPGLIVALLLTAVVVFRVHGGFPPLKSREKMVWAGNAQVFVDAQSSAVGNIHQALDPLIPRASVYANIMTSETLITLIGQAAHVPASDISVEGPVGTNGQRPSHAAASAPQTAPHYSLRLDTDATQPIIRITTQAPTSGAAKGLANGAASGLATYVTQLETSQQVPTLYRVNVRQLGQATVNATSSGITPSLFIPIFMIIAIGWCVLVLFVTRFVAAWRAAPEVSFEIPADLANEEFLNSVSSQPNGNAPEVGVGAPSGNGFSSHAPTPQRADR